MEPISTKKLHDLAKKESQRKTHWLVYPEKKGTGKDVASKGDNGDILTWNREGKIVNVENTFRRPNRNKPVSNTFAQSYASAAPVRTKNRRDFQGNGNIIGWC